MSSSYAVLDRHHFHRSTTVKRFEALLAAVAGSLHTSEGKLNAAASAVVVDENLPGLDLVREPQPAAEITGPDAGSQAEGGAVGDPNCISLVLDTDRHKNRSEDFLLRKRV